MTAEVLREAAALMRERADGRTLRTSVGPYTVKPDHTEAAMVGAEIHAARGRSICYVGSTIDDAEHMASWHPAVARAVADWLEQTARFAPPDPHHASESCETCENATAALAVATAYLGTTA